MNWLLTVENSLDFPSALYLCVYFLKKIEFKECNSFAGSSLVKFNDPPGGKAKPLPAKNITDPEQAHLRRYF